MSKYFNFFPKTLYSLEDNTNDLVSVTNIISRFSFENSLKENTSAFYEYEIRDSDTPEIIARKYYDHVERHWIVLLFNDIIDPQFDWPLSDENFIKYVTKKYSKIVSVTINSGGTGYSNGYINVESSNGIGEGANIYYTVNSTGAINNVFIVSGGTNYMETPTLNVSGGSGANLTATVTNGLSWARNINNVESYYKIITTTSNYDGVEHVETLKITKEDYANTGTSSTNYTLQNGETVTRKITTKYETYFDYEQKLNEQKRKIRLLKPEFVPAVEKEFKRVIK